ncbi:MAG: ribosomal-processing cysteine protease Prp [Candidatus Cybelea sp.]
MLELTFYRDERDRLCGLRARGHADFADHGKDIVCAAVSAVLQAAHLGLREHARAEVMARQEPGELELRLHENQRDRESVRAILATAELAVEQIARRFPKHVRFTRQTAQAREAAAQTG